MAKPDGRIEKGQRLSTAISARAWNRAQDAADIVLGVRPGVTADGLRGYERPYTWIYVYNNTGHPDYDIPRWGPVWLDEEQRDNFYNTNVNDSPENEAFFQDVPVLAGVPPTAFFGPDYNKPPVLWGIAVEPIAHSTIGRVAISGVVQCRLNVTSDSDTRVFLTASSKSEVSTGKNGDAVILHKDLGTGAGKWGLIRLGDRHAFRRAKITSQWNYGYSKQLTDDDGRVFEAFNYCHDLIVPLSVGNVQVLAERWVYCAEVNGEWHLIAWQGHLATPASLPQNTAIVPL
ncbi:MAG: hypothetical protein VKK63_11510 [Synechococcus sp.]|nr:hypothetical protein [Synechococcus sp.]